MERPHKPPFASWLIEQVNSGQYEGLCYVAPNRIRIPWKHNSKSDCSDVDTQIFHEWAVVSGKISVYPNNKAKWKTNFRCNLNNLEQHFKLIEDNSKTTYPHKIYEIINTKSTEENKHFNAVFVSKQQQFANNTTALEPGCHLLGGCLTEYFQYPTVQRNNFSDAIVKNAVPPLQVNPYLSYKNIDLEVSIHYKNRQMLKTRVNTARLQLHYFQEACENNSYPLCFPTTEGLRDHKQIEYTNRILNSIQRGLLLEVHESGIYGIRQDTCRMFASIEKPSMAQAHPKKLPQNTKMELFNFQKFCYELNEFKENKGGSPNYTITICFGEMFPDGKPLEKKLIVVQVVPLIFQNFHEMALSEGASSLNSANISLQLSHNSLYDFISSQLSPPTTEFSQQSCGDFGP
ncbi:interferon regulatory factor 7 isoform X1 [Syngnathus acus]|uniref:interferon regulatory factor 7 isoform X1 n=1 Tax=Syngnathus acus TaxID=161584 RepID=UPI00188613D5|nr:interferon regulatory factor 7 isoform X1 [Syngnathus acus]